MNYIQTEIDGVWIIEPKVFNDARGYFMEAFKEEEFRANIGDVHFVQDNESLQKYNAEVKKQQRRLKAERNIAIGVATAAVIMAACK
jgi:dTDP-4-dehydrorhamnose 3,5-epimerase-like enzyme